MHTVPITIELSQDLLDRAAAAGIDRAAITALCSGIIETAIRERTAAPVGSGPAPSPVPPVTVAPAKADKAVSDYEAFVMQRQTMSVQPKPVERPFGISLLAGLAVVQGLIGTIGGVAVFNQVNMLSNAGRIRPGSASPLLIMSAGVVISGIVSFVFAYGAWTLKPWARILGFILYGVSIGLNVLQLGDGLRLQDVASIGISIVVIYYLTREDVKEAFRPPAPKR